MAAMTAAPPPAASPPSSPSHRRSLPLQNISVGSADWAESPRALPDTPTETESPRLRQPPISPVRVNFQPENWAQASDVNIESSFASSLSLNGAAAVAERALPRTPDAPTPPPHASQTLSQPSFTLKPPPAVASIPIHGRQAASRLSTIRSVGTAPTHDGPVVTPSPAPASPLASSSTFVHPQPSSPSIMVPHASQVLGRSGSPGGATSPETTNRVSPREIATSRNIALRRLNGENRHSRETNGTASTSKQQTSTESSTTTSASSMSGANEPSDCANVSPETSLDEGSSGTQPVVPQLQYHHQPFVPHSASMNAIGSQSQAADFRSSSNPDLAAQGHAINRHLTPSQMRRSSLARPQSSYSMYSEFRGRSPGLYSNSHIRGSSNNSRGSPDIRSSSYADLLNVPYPQPSPAPITLDNAKLRGAVGSNASLLSVQKTLEMYRQNVKKTGDMSIQYSFAVFLISTAQEQGFTHDDAKRKNSPDGPIPEGRNSSPQDLVREARSILQRLSNAGYPFAQYYLADGYASGLFSKGKEDYNAAFPLFVLAAKHGHAESAYRTALCYEFGWGCRKDPAKAVQYLRIAATKRHPGAMTRLGKACLSGDLGEKRYREGLKWLKLASESADNVYNGSPYQLGCLYETGYGDDIFQDEGYAAELYTQAAELGHPDANFRMGDAYEHGKLNCPRDPALSVHFYTGAAERGHPAAMMGLCAWYMVGAEPLLEKDEEEAYEWAHRSAELGFVKAQYAVGYFTEMGIGCRRDILEANVWYVKAADAGDDRAKQRLEAIRVAVNGGTPIEVGAPRNTSGNGPKSKKGKGKETKKGIDTNGANGPDGINDAADSNGAAPDATAVAAGSKIKKQHGKDGDCCIM